MYIIKLNQGDYLEARGGSDWGRTDRHSATEFDTVAEARAWVDRLGITDIARVVAY